MDELNFKANYFDGKTSRVYPVNVRYDGSSLVIQGEGIFHDLQIQHLGILPALGQTRRVLHLPTGERLETPDLAAIAHIEARHQRNQGMQLVNRLEQRWRWVVTSVLVLIVFIFGFVRFGLPLVAKAAAFVTPIQVTGLISQQTLRLLDQQFLRPTVLPQERQDDLSRYFTQIAQEFGGNYDYQLEFRQGQALGANALALPSGIIVMTDELIELSENDTELIGVLAHEIAHVKHRHGLRSVYQSTGIYLLIATLLGDVTSVTSVAASLPAILVDSGYSRDFEREADHEAGLYLLKTTGSTQALQDILGRLSAEHGSDQSSFLASHPGTLERMNKLKEIQLKP